MWGEAHGQLQDVRPLGLREGDGFAGQAYTPHVRLLIALWVSVEEGGERAPLHTHAALATTPRHEHILLWVHRNQSLGIVQELQLKEI